MSDPSVRLEVSRIKGRDDLPVPPFPQPPELSTSITPIRGKLKLIQSYITSLEYNYTGEDFFVKKKDRGFRHVTSTAKLVIREALPIQCVEAVFVGAYLTADMAQVDRFPVCFRSSLDGRVYRHIILAVRSGKAWGALGLSRRDTLMYKELKYKLFSELMGDFRDSYTGSWHRLEHIWVGFPLPHDISSNVPVKWKVMRANVGTDAEWSSAAPNLDRFVACAPSLFERFSTTGKMPDHPLLSSSPNNDGPSSASSPSPTRHGNGDTGGGEGRADPRESPGARSPGVRSPGFPPYWLGPGSGEGGGGGRRRMSTPVGQGTARGNKSGSGSGGGGQGTGRRKKSSAHRPARGGGGGGGGRGGGGGGGTGGSTLIASPPRARARSAVAGGVHAAGGALARKPRRRLSNSKEGVGDGDSPGAPTPPTDASPSHDSIHNNKDAAASAVTASSGEEAKGSSLTLSTPKRLPV